jgi:hypothetical protein
VTSQNELAVFDSQWHVQDSINNRTTGWTVWCIDASQCWLNLFRWRNLIIEAGLPRLLKKGDQDSGPLKKEALYPYVKGKVLELGAGTGLTLAYYNHDAITQLILVEPFLKLHQELKSNITSKGSGFEAKTKIVPFGIEESQRLADVKEIEQASFDTIVLGASSFLLL